MGIIKTFLAVLAKEGVPAATILMYIDKSIGTSNP